MTLLTVYSGSIGINNKISPHRLLFDENGVSAFEDATNVLIDHTGEVVARRGYSSIDSGIYHSLFSGDDYGLVAKDRDDDTAIYQVVVSENGEVTLNGIWAGLTKGAKIDWCKIPKAIAYTNGYTNGMIVSGSRISWKESNWEDDESLVGFTDVLPADHLDYNAGRIYFSIDNVLYYTEFGHFGLYDPATDGEQFPSKVLVIASAVDGMYISDREAIYFLSGLNPKDWTLRKVTDYPAKEWGKCDQLVNPSFFGFETNIPSALLATEQGPFICLPSGQGTNLINKQVTMPDCPDSGAIGIFDETLIIQTGE